MHLPRYLMLEIQSACSQWLKLPIPHPASSSSVAPKEASPQQQFCAMLSSLWKTPSSAKMEQKPDPKPAPKPDPPAPFVNAWQVRADAGEPVAVVRVRNLQGAIPVGRDAWGRSNKLQPVLLSSEVSFAAPFATASADDKLTSETVHYGNLSKTLLDGLELWDQGTPAKTPAAAAPGSAEAGAEAEIKTPRTADIFELLWVRMTGRVVDGSRIELPLDQIPFLDAAKIRSLSLTMYFPKASLLGAGVSLTTTACFKEVPENNPLRSYSRSLRIHGLHIPTLIGINSNERTAKQMVVADVDIDRFDVTDDIHSDLERTIVEVSLSQLEYDGRY